MPAAAPQLAGTGGLRGGPVHPRPAANNPLLHTILTSARGGDDSLLPLLTTRSEPVLQAASAALCAYATEHYPDLDHERAAGVVDSVVRFIVSHLVLSVDPDTIGRRLGQLVLDGLHLPEDDLVVF